MFGRAAEQAEVSVKFSLVRGPDGDRGGRGVGGRLRWSFKVTVATQLRHVCSNNDNNADKREKKDESGEKPQKKRQVQGRRQRSRRHPGPRAAAPRTPANVLAR